MQIVSEMRVGNVSAAKHFQYCILSNFEIISPNPMGFLLNSFKTMKSFKTMH